MALAISKRFVFGIFLLSQTKAATCAAVGKASYWGLWQSQSTIVRIIVSVE